MENGQIYAAISAAMADISAIGKDKYNQQQGFKFRGIDDVMNALKPILTKNKIFTVPQVLEQTREIKVTAKGGELRYSLLKIAFRFYATDGSFVEAVTLGEGMDSGDKASNKAMAIAYKYALFQVFCIPTEEMTDPDGESYETKHETQKTGAAEAAEQANREPVGNADKLHYARVRKHRHGYAGVGQSSRRACGSKHRPQHPDERNDDGGRKGADGRGEG